VSIENVFLQETTFTWYTQTLLKNKLCINKEKLFQVKTIAEKKKVGICCRIQKTLKLLLK